MKLNLEEDSNKMSNNELNKMKMHSRTLKVLLLGGLLLNVAASCSSDNGDEPETLSEGVKPRLLTITEIDTRATLVASDNGLSAMWTTGDGLRYCNLSQTNHDEGIVSGLLTAKSSSAVSQFEGSVTCGSGDYLAVVYPATSFAFSGDSNAKYTITLSGQDGTLETLQEKFHCVYGVAKVKSVTETTATAEMMKMKSLLTVCRFSFVDKADYSPITLKTLAISYDADGANGHAGTYPQTATVVCGMTQADVHAIGVPSDSPLLIEGPGEAVALLPTSGKPTFRFTVTDNDGNTYTGTAKATLSEGEYVVATGLKLTKNN